MSVVTNVSRGGTVLGSAVGGAAVLPNTGMDGPQVALSILVVGTAWTLAYQLVSSAFSTVHSD